MNKVLSALLSACAEGAHAAGCASALAKALVLRDALPARAISSRSQVEPGNDPREALPPVSTGRRQRPVPRHWLRLVSLLYSELNLVYPWDLGRIFF